ncbi:MAG: iron-containing alcohol dehydrogenase [Ardenticatenaceae bacterium]|nr:iron-containing alcohol dehydrogenase [Ardenticatenaceae bacterium]MCB9446111.1 iron-containing alcohol dehydrogenase [Ardenticatenaceae bacterium]
MKFEFATANRIIFGAGTSRQIAEYAQGFGKRPFLITGQNSSRAEFAVQALQNNGFTVTQFAITDEPSTPIVLEGVTLARDRACDFVIGIGGGSVIDGAKAIAALLTNDGQPLDYLEVVGKGQPLQNAPAPAIAVPTTAGTGAEVTRNAVLTVPEQRVKVSLRSPLMLPDVAIVDPELTYSMPPGVTAVTGLDALTQLIEPFVSHLANPLTDALCREGFQRAGQSLRRAYENGRDTNARNDMALASLLGGLALANAKLGAVHGFAGPIGGMFSAPHGAVCARLLPYTIEANVRALQSRQPENPALQRYTEIARILTGDPAATVQDGVQWIQSLCADLQIPGLATYGLTANDLPTVVNQSKNASSMKGNPIQLSEAELMHILEQAL